MATSNVAVKINSSPYVVRIGKASGQVQASGVYVRDASNLYGQGDPLTLQALADQVASLLALKAGGTVDNFTALRYTATPQTLSLTFDGFSYTANWDISAGAFASLTLDNDATLDLSNQGASFITLLLTQDATGGRTLSFSGSEIICLTDNVTTGANSVTVYNFVYNANDNLYYGTGLTVSA